MMKDMTTGFCVTACLLKPVLKFILELWLCAVEYIFGKYESLCSVLKLLPRVFWLAVRSREYIPARSDGDSNDCVDKLLAEMFKDGKYDPCEFENVVNKFDKTVAFVNVTGEASVDFAYITGLKTLHRTNHASLKENGKLKAELGVGELDLYCRGRLEFMNIGHTLTFQGKIAYMEFHIELSLDSESKSNGRLNEFVIYDMRGVNVQITDFTPLDMVLNKIIALFMKTFRRLVQNLIEIRIENYIRENIRDFQFPASFRVESEATENGACAAEPTDSTREPIVAEASKKQMDAFEQDPEGIQEGYESETLDIPERSAPYRIITAADEPMSVSRSKRRIETIEFSLCELSSSSSSDDMSDLEV